MSALKPYKWKKSEGKVGDLVWCCHHEVLIEVLTEPAENRVAYIKSNKPAREQDVRLYAFRPVKGKLPRRVTTAYAEWDKIGAEWDKIGAEWDKARAEWRKACVEWDEACAECQPQLLRMFAKVCPDVEFKPGPGLVFTQAEAGK